MLQYSIFRLVLFFFLVLNLFLLNNSVKVINNGLAPPEIVHTPILSKRELFILQEYF